MIKSTFALNCYLNLGNTTLGLTELLLLDRIVLAEDIGLGTVPLPLPELTAAAIAAMFLAGGRAVTC